VRLVYIAGPYRGRSDTEVRNNIARAKEVAVELIRKWHTPFNGHEKSLRQRLPGGDPFPVTPHLNTANFDFVPSIAELAGADYYLAGTMKQLQGCSAVILTRHDAGFVSTGTRDEIYEANRMGIPVFDSVDAYLYYRENAAYHRQIDDMCENLSRDPHGARIGRTFHIFGEPHDKSQPSL